jgi:hypothetical protein
LGKLLKLQFENDKLEFLVERLCLPMNFAMALALFDAAKVEMIPAFIEKIAEIEEEAAKIDQLLPLTNEGKLDALSDFTSKVGKIDALSAFTKAVKNRRIDQERHIIMALENVIRSAAVVTEVPMTPMEVRAGRQADERLRRRQNGTFNDRER